MNWLLAILGLTASAQDMPPETQDAAASGWEWWAAGGGAAILSGGGGTVIVKKALALLSLESEVKANAEALKAATASVAELRTSLESRSQREDTINAAISTIDGRVDALHVKLGEMETRITAASAPSVDEQQRRDAFVELKTDVKHLRSHVERVDTAVEGVRTLLLEAQRSPRD